MIFIIALVFTFIIKLRFPKEVSIATIIKYSDIKYWNGTYQHEALQNTK